MREEITATVQMIYTCPAEASLSEQSDLIHNDIVRLLDADSTTNVELTALTIQHLQPEAMTYGNAGPRNPNLFQADRMTALLKDVYLDTDDIAEALSYALCDLRHLADANNLAFGLWDKTGHAYYTEERGSANAQKRKSASLVSEHSGEKSL